MISLWCVISSELHTSARIYRTTGEKKDQWPSSNSGPTFYLGVSATRAINHSQDPPSPIALKYRSYPWQSSWAYLCDICQNGSMTDNSLKLQLLWRFHLNTLITTKSLCLLFTSSTFLAVLYHDLRHFWSQSIFRPCAYHMISHVLPGKIQELRTFHLMQTNPAMPNMCTFTIHSTIHCHL